MKRSMSLLVAMALALGLSLSQQACTVRFVVVPPVTPTPNPYPNAWHIETRIVQQINRITMAYQAGTLDQSTTHVLVGNDELIRRFAREYRAPSNQTLDLTYQQTVLLDNMLNDNAAFIDDALENHSYWVQYFGEDDFDYYSAGSHAFFICYLEYQLVSQQNSVDSGTQSGQLTAKQAQELRDRIEVIRSLKRSDFRQNGRLDLSEEQVAQLSQMTRDNARYLRFLLKGGAGRWDKKKFTSWKSQVPQGLGQGGGHAWGRMGWGKTKGKPTDTSTTSAPTPTPVVSQPPREPTPVPPPQVKTLPATPTPPAVAAPTPTPEAAKTQGPPPRPGLRLIAPGQLIQFLAHEDQTVRKALKSGDLSEAEAAALNQKLDDLHQKADGFLKQNKAKSVTPDQMKELGKMAAEIHKSLSGGSKPADKEVAPSDQATPTPESGDTDSDSTPKGKKKHGRGHGEDQKPKDEGDN